MSRVRIAMILSALLAVGDASAQLFKKTFPGRTVDLQYAGSIGSFSIGTLRHTRNDKLALGLNIGHVPRSAGGSLNIVALRFQYDPWRVRLGKDWVWHPMQLGAFISYTSGYDLRATWPEQFEKGYYWWFPNFRQHPYLRTMFGRRTHGDRVPQVSAYLEVNTNDLYIYSWFPNRGSISVGDILFLGAGMQVRLKGWAPRSAPPRSAPDGPVAE